MRAGLVVVDPEAQVDVLVAGHRRQCGDLVKLVHHAVLPPHQHPECLRPHRVLSASFAEGQGFFRAPDPADTLRDMYPAGLAD